MFIALSSKQFSFFVTAKFSDFFFLLDNEKYLYWVDRHAGDGSAIVVPQGAKKHLGFLAIQFGSILSSVEITILFRSIKPVQNCLTSV